MAPPEPPFGGGCTEHYTSRVVWSCGSQFGEQTFDADCAAHGLAKTPKAERLASVASDLSQGGDLTKIDWSWGIVP